MNALPLRQLLAPALALALGCAQGEPPGAPAGGDPGPGLLRTPGWSARALLRGGAGPALVLEEVLVGFAVRAGPSRLRRLATDASPERTWAAPEGLVIADAARHPSGEVTAVLVGEDGAVSLARLAPDLAPIALAPLHDPDLAGDPFNAAAGETELRAHLLFSQGTAARAAADGEQVVVAVDNAASELIAYRLSFADGWSTLRRTVVEPPTGLTPLIPIGGSFDTFGAMDAWFRPLLGVDDDGNAYLAIWASPRRIQRHAAAFGDGLAPLASDPESANDSDVLLTKVGRDGARAWSRVVGTAHEDEPYALRVAAGQVAVVGRARRNPSFDNTFWDGFAALTSTQGEPLGARALQLDQSSIFLAVDRLDDAGWVVGGSEGWSQNPGGLSVLSFGRALLIGLPALDGQPVRRALPAGPRHAELRSVVAGAGIVSFAGHEDGPVMHTGDADPGLIRGTGLVGALPR